MNQLLTLLPNEIIVQILQLLPPLDVLRFGLASASCQALLKDNEDSIWQGVAELQYDAYVPMTASDSGISRYTIDYPDLKGLARAVACQRTPSSYYESIGSWKEFVRLKHRLAANWTRGVPVVRACQIRHAERDVWRFKVCPERRIILASVYMQDGETLDDIWALPIESTRLFTPSAEARHPQTLRQGGGQYTHIEFTHGLLIYCDSFKIHVLRVCDDITTGNIHALVPVHEITPLCRISSYKARYPYLVTESHRERRLCVFDLVSGQLAENYALEARPGYSYIEIDEVCIIQANSSITLTDRRTGARLNLLDPQLFPGATALNGSQFFSRMLTLQCLVTCVHHSLDGKHLIAGTTDGELLWLRNFRSWSSMTPDVRRDSLVKLSFYQLDAEGDAELAGNMRITNVCVENGRVAFTAQRLPGANVLYTFDLSELNDHHANLPRIRSLGCVPTSRFNGVTRLECDSTAIYATGASAGLDRPEYCRIVFTVSEENMRMVWINTDGRVLAHAVVDAVHGLRSQEDPADAANIGNQDPTGRWHTANDAVLVFDFAACGD